MALPASGPRRVPILHASDALLVALARCAADRFALQPVRSWRAFGEAAAPPVAVAVVDPYFGTTPEEGVAGELRSFLQRRAGIRVIASLCGTPLRLDDVRLLGEWGVAAIASCDAAGLAARIEAQVSVSTPDAALSWFHPLARQGPPARHRLLAAAVAVVGRGGGVRELARELHMAPRSLQRHFDRASLAPPHAVITCARVVTASELLWRTRYGIDRVAHSCGYRSASALRAATRQLLGLRPTELRDRARAADAIRACVAALAESAKRGDPSHRLSEKLP